MQLFIRHLIYDVLAKKTLDKVFKLIRKLDWDNDEVKQTLYKVFTKPWKIKYGNISLLAMLTYDLQRYRPAFAISVVDQVLENVRRGLEQNVYSTNQRRLATIKFLGELYIYRLVSSSIIFDTLWSITTFGHRESIHLICTVKLILCNQLRAGHFLKDRSPLICRMISFASDWSVLCWIPAACVSTAARRRRNWTTFWSFSKFVLSYCMILILTFCQYYILCKDPLPMDIEFTLTDSLEVRNSIKTTEMILIATGRSPKARDAQIHRASSGRC